MKNVKRLLLDLALFVGIAILFMIRAYEIVPAPLQLLALKVMLVSAALIHAHIARKLLFPSVNWNSSQMTGGAYVAIGFYIFIPICYAFGG